MNIDRRKQILQLMIKDKTNLKKKSKDVCCCSAEKEAILVNRPNCYWNMCCFLMLKSKLR